MNRRTFLQSNSASALIALAGCSTSVESDEREKINTTVNQDEESPIEYSVEVVNEEHSEKPYTFEVSLTNTLDERVIYGEARQAVFHGSSDQGSPFILLPTSWTQAEYNTSAEVWVSAGNYVVTMEYAISTLDPQETTTETLYLLHDKTENGESVEPYPEQLTFSTSLKASPAEDHNGFQVPDSESYTTELRINIERFNG